MDDTFKIRELAGSDLERMLPVFNYFAENGYAVYTDLPLTFSQFKKLAESIKIGLILEEGDDLIGFGYISTYKPYPNFDSTGVLTYFIMPEYTGKGLGTKLFNLLIEKGRLAGINNYLAHISSKNEQSLSFHKKMGFETVGVFKNVAIKQGELFDIVWVQKQYKP